jgi:hypothetical protein
VERADSLVVNAHKWLFHFCETTAGGNEPVFGNVPRWLDDDYWLGLFAVPPLACVPHDAQPSPSQTCG